MQAKNHLSLQELQRCLAVYEDEAAYKELFFRLYYLLKKFAVSIVRSKELAEEIASDVFIEIWARRLQLLAITDLKMYMYTCTRNAAVKKIKESQKNKIQSLYEFNFEFKSEYSNPEEELLSGELVHKIETAVNALPPRCKLIFKLAKEDKLRYREIAKLLDISIKTIDNQLATALKRISVAINFRLKKSTLK